MRRDRFDRALDAVRRIPGVDAAGFSVFSPLSGTTSSSVVRAVGEPTPDDRSAMVHWVSPGWFAAYRTPMLAGRDFNERDRAGATPVAIVNEAFARHFLGTRPPVGHSVQETAAFTDQVSREVVGVVADAVYQSTREAARPTIYLPFAQADRYRRDLYSSVTIGARAATGPPLALSRPIEAAIANVDPTLSLTFRPMEEQIDGTLAQERLIAMLAGFFGVLAVGLAALGLYGVTAYGVTRRRTELGIRLALGASPSGVVRMVLARSLLLVSLGLVAGVVVSLYVSRFVAALLYGLQPHDPAVFVGATAVLTVSSAIAAWGPAWRASRIDPAVVLRND
jgi:predicted permease